MSNLKNLLTPENLEKAKDAVEKVKEMIPDEALENVTGAGDPFALHRFDGQHHVFSRVKGICSEVVRVDQLLIVGFTHTLFILSKFFIAA